jgi:hypothetical protein
VYLAVFLHTHAQSSSGAASTLERLTKETDVNISQVHGDVAAKKNLVSSQGWVGWFGAG